MRAKMRVLCVRARHVDSIRLHIKLCKNSSNPFGKESYGLEDDRDRCKAAWHTAGLTIHRVTPSLHQDVFWGRIMIHCMDALQVCKIIHTQGDLFGAFRCVSWTDGLTAWLHCTYCKISDLSLWIQGPSHDAPDCTGRAGVTNLLSLNLFFFLFLSISLSPSNCLQSLPHRGLYCMC